MRYTLGQVVNICNFNMVHPILNDVSCYNICDVTKLDHNPILTVNGKMVRCVKSCPLTNGNLGYIFKDVYDVEYRNQYPVFQQNFESVSNLGLFEFRCSRPNEIESFIDTNKCINYLKTIRSTLDKTFVIDFNIEQLLRSIRE